MALELVLVLENQEYDWLETRLLSPEQENTKLEMLVVWLAAVCV